MAKIKERDITVTLRVASSASESTLRELLAAVLCDTLHEHQTDNEKPVVLHILGVDAGEGNAVILNKAPFHCAGQCFPHIVGWSRGERV